MSAALYTELAWLPAPAQDFAVRCRALTESTTPGADVRSLANCALDENRGARLGRAITAAIAKSIPLAPLVPFKLGVIGTGTLDLLAPLLVASAARHGFALTVVQAPYGQVTQEAFDPDSTINAARPDAVLIALDHRGFDMPAEAGDVGAEREAISAAITYLGALREAIRRNSGAICIVQTVAPGPDRLFGSFDAIQPGTARRQSARLNEAIADSIAGTPDLLLDVASLAETVGLAAWHSPAQWNLAKLPCDASCLPTYAEHVARLVGAARGRSRKCLILDLDNTLWGGVIGDDGLTGIRLAQGDATGEAHLELQRWALALRRRGIVLAVCSKNEDETARIPFRSHPEMLLREDHIAVFQANWNDKATNIVAIAAELSLGLDAMVFVDDNPAERALVRRMLPDVAVPELPEDPALYTRTVAAGGYFEAIAFSQEDRARAEMYQSNARRVALQKQAGDIEAWLASLQMEIGFAPFDAVGRARIAQLINKSNQFNLTTRRYGEAEVEAAERDPDVFTLQVRLADTLGDNGMISVVICRPDEPGAWKIDTWLMSCRVLGRRVEHAVLREILAAAREAGMAQVIGVYRPTGRNGLVRDHYRKLGFTLIREEEDSATMWSMATVTDIAMPPMTVTRQARVADLV